jgi:hypothetical protein
MTGGSDSRNPESSAGSVPTRSPDERSDIRGLTTLSMNPDVASLIRATGLDCVARNEPRTNYRPVFTFVHSRLMMRWVAGSRAVMTNSFCSVASSG